jgi:hypothetical protein
MRGLHALTDGVRLLMHEICNHHDGMMGIFAGHPLKTARFLPFPRLSYLGEVAVECSHHGSPLLWRLLENYPTKDLLIVEGIHRSSVERRLPGVRYIHRPLCWCRSR